MEEAKGLKHREEETHRWACQGTTTLSPLSPSATGAPKGLKQVSNTLRSVLSEILLVSPRGGWLGLLR